MKHRLMFQYQGKMYRQDLSRDGLEVKIEGKPQIVDIQVDTSDENAVEGNQIRGAGDLIAKVTDAAGIKKCGGCQKRQKKLNKWIPFGRRKSSR
tara:strand:- start:178 stop:459 length:282 start_codon:yes stop_codon:yes gene_type:complete